MGVYVWVSKYCCNEELQFQSKSHPDREYGDVDADSVPVQMAKDIDGDRQECPHCLRVYRIKVKDRDYATVPMEIVCENEGEVGLREDYISKKEEHSYDDETEEDSTEDRLKEIERHLGIRK
jgi:hypothetical protein